MATILLAEDNEAVRLLTQAKLRHQFTVVTAANGRETLDILNRQHVDLIVADVMMPVMDGIQAAKTIRAMNRPDAQKVIILAMTAQTAQECVDECSRSGMNGHIAKPMESRQLVKQILENM